MSEFLKAMIHYRGLGFMIKCSSTLMEARHVSGRLVHRTTAGSKYHDPGLLVNSMSAASGLYRSTKS